MQAEVQEVWKAIPGTGGLYEISNLGRARSYRTPGSTKMSSLPVILTGRSDGRARSVQYIDLQGRLVERSMARLVREIFVEPEEASVPVEVTVESKEAKVESPKLVASNSDFTMVAIDEVPRSPRYTRKTSNLYDQILEDFVKSGHKAVKVSRPDVKDTSTGNELRKARRRHPRKYAKVVVNAYKGAGVYLSWKE
jgi:hypothetical protein